MLCVYNYIVLYLYIVLYIITHICLCASLLGRIRLFKNAFRNSAVLYKNGYAGYCSLCVLYVGAHVTNFLSVRLVCLVQTILFHHCFMPVTDRSVLLYKLQG